MVHFCSLVTLMLKDFHFELFVLQRKNQKWVLSAVSILLNKTGPALQQIFSEDFVPLKCQTVQKVCPI